MKNYFVLVVAFGCLCVTAPRAEPQTDPSPELEASIRELMEVSGVVDLGPQMMQQMMAPLMQQMPNVPDDVWKGIVGKVDMNGLVDLSIPIYAKHFTKDELDVLVAFYRTPVGKKAISTMPAIMQEMMSVGQKWGQAEAQRIFQELKALGYEPPR